MNVNGAVCFPFSSMCFGGCLSSARWATTCCCEQANGVPKQPWVAAQMSSCLHPCTGGGRVPVLRPAGAGQPGGRSARSGAPRVGQHGWAGVDCWVVQLASGWADGRQACSRQGCISLPEDTALVWGHLYNTQLAAAYLCRPARCRQLQQLPRGHRLLLQLGRQVGDALRPVSVLPRPSQGCLVVLRAARLCCTAGAACGAHPAAGEHRMLDRVLREPGAGGLCSMCRHIAWPRRPSSVPLITRAALCFCSLSSHCAPRLLLTLHCISALLADSFCKGTAAHCWTTANAC